MVDVAADPANDIMVLSYRRGNRFRAYLAVTSQGPVALSNSGSERLMLKNAFGFGGHNISLVLSAPGSTAEQQR